MVKKRKAFQLFFFSLVFSLASLPGQNRRTVMEVRLALGLGEEFGAWSLAEEVLQGEMKTQDLTPGDRGLLYASLLDLRLRRAATEPLLSKQIELGAEALEEALRVVEQGENGPLPLLKPILLKFGPGMVDFGMWARAALHLLPASRRKEALMARSARLLEEAQACLGGVRKRLLNELAHNWNRSTSYLSWQACLWEGEFLTELAWILPEGKKKREILEKAKKILEDFLYEVG